MTSVGGNSKKALGLAFVANSLWGTSFLAAQVALRRWDPLAATIFAFVCALAFMLALYFIFPSAKISLPRSSRVWIGVIGVGATGFGFFYPSLYFGLQLIPSSISAVILLASPIFVTVLSSVLLREAPSRWQVVGLIMGISGCVLTLGLGSLAHDPQGALVVRGALFTLCASFMLACSVVITRRYAGDLDSVSLTFWSMLFGLLMLVTVDGFIGASGSLSFPVSSFWTVPALAAAYSGVICTAVCCLLWNRAISLAPASELAPSMYLKTPVAILLGTLAAKDPLSAKLIGGGVLVAFGVIFSQKRGKSE